MLLLIDAGNTLLKWALAPAGPAAMPGQASWLHTGSVPRQETATLCTHLQEALAGQEIRRIVISNVAGPATAGHITRLIEKLAGNTVPVSWFTSLASLAGVTNTYADPARLGSDRFASLIGARFLFPKENLVVVTCGTATTIDTLTASGVFLGGMILPGLRLMTHSLAANTAQLPEIGSTAQSLPPCATDTAAAILAGCLTAQAGAIEHAVSVHAAGLGPVRCLLSGGAARQILPCLSIPAQIVDNLVLVGLHAADASRHATDCSC